jgi:hypothetical protein
MGMDPWRRRGIALVSLALLPVAGVAVLAAVSRSGPAGGGDSKGSPSRSPEVSETRLREEFLAAYEQSRRATWLVTYAYHRQVRNGSRLDVELTELNRPPDHLVTGLGGLNGRVGDRQVVCNEVGGAQLCGPGGPAGSFEDELVSQLAELRDVLQPPARWYVLERGGRLTLVGERARCYRLRRAVDVPAPPYGERAEYCYAADGAPLLTRIERREGTDERVASRVRRDVADADVQAMLIG